ncbi:MAG: hypothetical protein ABF743_03985 [Schleiferilactobacillus perolens]|uniref:hypothetical protein n=1 Tax=Schleiferilactobacillus perolens TaxID=100468 RepID=UPI0039E9340E
MRHIGRWLSVFAIILLCTLTLIRLHSAGAKDNPNQARFSQVRRQAHQLHHQTMHRQAVVDKLGEPNSQVIDTVHHRQVMHWRYPHIGRVTVTIDQAHKISVSSEKY